MSRLRLIHWNAAEAERYVKLLEDAGHRVEYFPEFSPQLMREWRTSPPDAFVIDLSLLPLPDAVFCPFSRLKSWVRQLKKSAAPVVPVSMMDRYGARTTAQKLGVREGDAVRLIDAPRDMPGALGELPLRVTFVESSPAAVTLLFAIDPQTFFQRLSEFRSLATMTKLWVCWRKGKSMGGGVSERLVRETGISLGLVDYKVCSINEIWSGLLFSYKTSTK